MTPPPDRDLLVEALVMLRDAKVQMATAIAMVSDEIARREERYRELLQAVQEADEAVTSMGGAPCGDIHPNYVGCTHECYVPPDEVEHIEACGE